MEIKDISMEAKDLSEVRGGRNSASNESHNGGILNLVGVGGHAFNNSGVTINNGVGQSNTTTQNAMVADVRTHDYSLSFDRSQLFAGFGLRAIELS